MAHILCTFGYHSGTWVDDPQRGPCAQRRMCTRCPAEPRRTVHDHQLPPDGRLIYVADEDDCYVHGQCTRCGNIGGALGVIHRWGPFSTVRQESDQTIVRRYCQHCGGHDERVSEPLNWDS